jgi:uncharacterized protein YjbI with pentapeptide repeats
MQSLPTQTTLNLVHEGGLCNTSHDFNRWHFHLRQQFDTMTTEQPKTALTSLLDRILASHVQHHSFPPLQKAINGCSINNNHKVLNNLFDVGSKGDLLVVFTPILERAETFLLLLGNSPISPVFRHDGEHGQIEFRSPSLTHFIIEEFRGGWKTLAYAYLAHISVPGANLTKIDCCHANMRGANLIFTNLTNADLSYADLTGSNLSGADLSEANLTGANLTAAVLKDANLTDTDLTDVIFGDTVMPNGEIV